MGIGRKQTGRLVAAVAGIVLASPASALAADTYVDGNAGDDSNPCTLAEPCATINHGVATATASATVYVDPDTYTESVVVDLEKRLIAEDFVGGAEGPATVSAGAMPALSVQATGAGKISGFAFTSSANPAISGGGTVDFDGNTVNVLGEDADGIAINAGGFDAAVTDNRFLGDDVSAQTAIRIQNVTSPSVGRNEIGAAGAGFNGGVFLNGTPGSPSIFENRFRAMHEADNVTTGQPILLEDAAAQVIENSVRASASGAYVQAVGLFETAVAPTTGAALHRNAFYGTGDGIGVAVDAETLGAVTLDGDLIAGFNIGIDAWADLSVVGATIVSGFPSDIQLHDNALTLDSTILAKGISSSPGASCAISYSRGPTTTPGGDGCDAFQTRASPGFVAPDPPSGEPDLHLLQTSAMVDAGNPAAPPGGSTDIDGDPRALSGQCSGGPARRDIGADELAELDCDPPQTRIKGKKRSKKPRVRFKLISDESGSSFRCKLDRRPYRKCKARYRTPWLDNGRHRLKAKATDASGNQDPTAAVKRFRVVVAD